MDLSKLKKRPSYPFETIAVAVAFSSRFEFLLIEAKRLSDVIGAHLLLLHIGEKSREKEQMLDEMMAKCGIDSNKSRVGL